MSQTDLAQIQWTCFTCGFRSPTEAGTRFGEYAPAVGRCEPAGSDDNWSPAIFTWPAVAVAWDAAGWDSTGSLLLTNAGFGSVAWRARADRDDQ